MLNEEQANKAGLLHKIQFAVETVDVSKFYEAIILYSMEYDCTVPNNNVNGYGKGFLSALEIVSGYEDRLIFVSMDHFNSYVYSARFMLA